MRRRFAALSRTIKLRGLVFMSLKSVFKLSTFILITVLVIGFKNSKKFGNEEKYV